MTDLLRQPLSRRRMHAAPLLAASLAALALGAASARAGEVSATYNVSFLGLSIGEATMTSATDGIGYRTAVNAKVAGIAAVFAPGHGTAVSTGRVVANRIIPASFTSEIHSGGEVQTTKITHANGAMSAVVRTPEKPPHPRATPVLPEHLRGVLDPLAVGIFTAGPTGPVVSASACERRTPVYSGVTRFDLIFSYAETKAVEFPGYKGEAVVCNVRVEPIAGYRPGPDMEALRERLAQVVLVPITGLRTLMPAQISVTTAFGTGVARATRLDVDPKLPQNRRAALD